MAKQPADPWTLSCSWPRHAPPPSISIGPSHQHQGEPSAQPGAGASSGGESDVWVCGQCTLENPACATACEACGGPSPRRSLRIPDPRPTLSCTATPIARTDEPPAKNTHGVHPGGNPGANLKSISHICHPILVVFVSELTKETTDLPPGCLHGRMWGDACGASWQGTNLNPKLISHDVLIRWF